MSRFVVALRLSLLTLSRSWFFLVSLLPPVLILLLTGAIAAGLAFYPNLEQDQFQAFGYLAALTIFLFLFGLALILGVIAVKRELRERSVKMLLCRPVGFHQWLAARLLGGVIVLTVAAVANGVALAATLGVLGFPFGRDQVMAGFLVYASLIALYAYAAFLSTVMHEIPAAMVAVFFNGPIYRGIAYLGMTIAKGIEAATENKFSSDLVTRIFQAVYVPWPDTFLPTSLFTILNLDGASHPFPPTFLTDGAWAVLYAANLILIFYALTAAVLRRRNLT